MEYAVGLALGFALGVFCAIWAITLDMRKGRFFGWTERMEE